LRRSSSKEEKEHVDWLEEQLDQLEQISIQLYLSRPAD
jgi:bacterioferritin (cytochrome b1)